jgi:hypothetical protein
MRYIKQALSGQHHPHGFDMKNVHTLVCSTRPDAATLTAVDCHQLLALHNEDITDGSQE